MTKMVIVVRRDLHMRKGKEIAQACHGAVNIILKALDRDGLPWYTVGDGRIVVAQRRRVVAGSIFQNS